MRTIAALSVLTLMLASSAMAQNFTNWATDPQKKVHTCDYNYTTKDNKPAVQKVVIYYADPDRKDWAYFYNAKNEPWARCAVPGNKGYDPKVMYWQQLEPTAKKSYVEYPTKGFCPTPGDGKVPVPALPLPPK